nr:hypothetical protein [Polyangiaceae bacterium]
KLFVFDRQKSELRPIAQVPPGGFFGPHFAFVGASSVFFISLDEATFSDRILRLPKGALGGPAPEPVTVLSQIENGTYSLLGVDGDAAVVIDDTTGDLLRASRASNDEPAVVQPVFAESAGALPYFEWFATDEAGYYFASSNDVGEYAIRFLPRGKDRLADLTVVSRDEPFSTNLSTDEASVYWVAETTGRSLRIAPKDGSTGPRTIVEDLGTSGYAVQNGYVYWVDPTSRELRGLRVR